MRQSVEEHSRCLGAHRGDPMHEIRTGGRPSATKRGNEVSAACADTDGGNWHDRRAETMGYKLEEVRTLAKRRHWRIAPNRPAPGKERVVTGALRPVVRRR